MKNRILKILKRNSLDNVDKTARQEMLLLFHQPEIEYELKGCLLENINDFEVSETPSTDYDKLFNTLWTKIEKHQNQPEPKTIKLGLLIKIAAVIVIGLVLGFYINSLVSDKEIIYYSAYSPRGSVSEMIFPDSTIVYLNSDSHIKYTMNGEKDQREVYLTGEAWFDVTKNREKPFVVHTSYHDVKVTGTQFNVKAYEEDNEVTTTLENGQIIIPSTNNFELTRSIVLKPGEQVVLNKETRKMVIKEVNTKWVTSWKDNKLIFVNISLKELVILLERKYGVTIDVKNKELLDLHFDGTIKNESILEIMEIVEKALHINYRVVGQKIEITK